MIDRFAQGSEPDLTSGAQSDAEAPNSAEQPASSREKSGDAEPSAGNTTNPGGGVFDPARWKTQADTRLDPKADIKPAAFTKIEIGKPPKDHFVHVQPNPAFNAVFPLYADSETKKPRHYLIAPELELVLPPQVRVNIVQTRLAVTITDTGRLFLWKMPQTGSEWHESGDNAILVAMTRWVKVLPETSGYRIEHPLAELPEPVFPDCPFAFYLERAFGRDGYVADESHEIIKRLAGLR